MVGDDEEELTQYCCRTRNYTSIRATLWEGIILGRYTVRGQGTLNGAIKTRISFGEQD